jgi:hypothetical protein
MSVLRNPVQPLALTTQAGLIRLLLECRFDFQHKIWSAPKFESRSDDGLSSALDRDALLPLLSAVISDFSDPAPGGEKSPRLPFRRMGIRSRRLSGKLKTKKEK